MKRYAGMTCWYRLAFRHQGHAWLYPTTKGPSLRFDGLWRATPGFRRLPYELTVVPMRQMYHITLATESWARVLLPVGDSGPSEVEPCRPLQSKTASADTEADSRPTDPPSITPSVLISIWATPRRVPLDERMDNLREMHVALNAANHRRWKTHGSGRSQNSEGA